MKKLIFLNYLLITLFLAQSVSAAGVGCSAAYDCSRRGVGPDGIGPNGEANNSCGSVEWESKLITTESGNRYDVEYSAQGALGRYQFVNGTRNTIGNMYNLPCAGDGGQAGREGFRNCEGLQDDYFRALTTYNVTQELASTCDQYCETTTHECTVTMSGMAAIAHNVGPNCARAFARGGYAEMRAQPPIPNTGQTIGCTDANGTNAAEQYGCAKGGHDMSAYGYGDGAPAGGCNSPYSPGAQQTAPYQGHLLGCDPEILNSNKLIIDAVNAQAAEIGKANITKPTSIEQMTCADQQLELVNEAGGIHSQPDAGNISDTLGPLAQAPLRGAINSLLGIDPETGEPDPNSLGAIINGTNPIDNIISSAFQNLTSSVFGPIGNGNNTMAGNTNCGMIEQTWLVNQCVEMPTIPSVSQIIGGELGEITGAIGNALNPARALEQVCNAASGQINGLTNNANSAFERAADDALTPITDSLGDLP